MNHYKSSSQLKSLAKGQLLGKYSTVIGAFVLTQLLMLILSWLPVFFVDTTTLFGVILDYLITFLISLFSGIFAAGQAYIYLNISCGRNCKASDVFYGFKQHPDKALLLQLVVSGISTLSVLPAYVLLLITGYTQDIILVLPTCILLIVGAFIAIYFTLAFSQVYYLLLDFPEYSVKQILSVSMKIMKGHKARLFYIMVSFLPLYLLAFLSCGIGMFWIAPYANATMTNFYLDLIKNRQP
ncbi:MAG: DUF975 family protein [Lachnospiraceae bacterium]|nr:DUF975 family protein [Lachnospiraceae bacterium]